MQIPEEILDRLAEGVMQFPSETKTEPAVRSYWDSDFNPV